MSRALVQDWASRLGERVIRARYREQFQLMGIDAVREAVEHAKYPPEQLEHARLWVQQQDDAQRRALDDEQMSLMREQARVARSANRAAWIAAITAIIAAAIAIYSMPNIQISLWKLFSP